MMWLEQVWASIAAWWGGIETQFYDNLIAGDRYQMIFRGLGVTLEVALCSAVIGTVLGCAIALMRLSKSKILRGISGVYVDIIRGTPLLVQLLIIYHLILVNVDSQVLIAIIAFSVNSAAYVSEIVRSGILAIDKGQTEAGRSLGLSSASTMLLIVMPQAIKIIIPSLFNEFIALLKETSIVGYIGLMDVTKAGDFIRSRTFSAFFPYITVAAIYLIIVTVLSRVFAAVERRMRQGDNR